MASLPAVTFSAGQAAPLYQQLYQHLQAAILTGELAGGSKLPSTRALAEELHVSRNTVLNAYNQLAAEGYLEGTPGSGTYVARELAERPVTAPARPRRGAEAPKGAALPRFSENARRQLAAPRMADSLSGLGSGRPRPFNFGMPAQEAFPHALWARLVARQARRLPASAFTYQNPAGYRPLREAIATHATVSRRVHCTPDQVVIVSGSQGALDLTARLLLNAGDPVWMEDPGYLGARGAFLGVGAHPVPVPVDGEGLVVEAGVARAPEARLVYITPSHQFPLGMTMSLPRRLALLAWARRVGAYILEDDYDSEYRATGRALPALQGLDEAERVIYVGTFSKVLFPALRLGYLILPPPLVESFLAVRSLIDAHTPILEQAVLADFMGAGHFARHLRRMRALYAERRAALLEALARLPLEVQAPEVGIHCVAWLPAGMEARGVVERAATQGVRVTPIAKFALEPMARQGLVLGYAEFTAGEMKLAARHLAAALRAG